MCPTGAGPVSRLPSRRVTENLRSAVSSARGGTPTRPIDRYPVAPTARLLLSGQDALVQDPAAVQDGTWSR